MSATAEDIILSFLPNLRAYVQQHNSKARMFNCRELNADELTDDDRIRLLEQIDDDMLQENLTAKGTLPSEAVVKKKAFLVAAVNEIQSLGRVVPASKIR